MCLDLRNCIEFRTNVQNSFGFFLSFLKWPNVFLRKVPRERPTWVLKSCELQHWGTIPAKFMNKITRHDSQWGDHSTFCEWIDTNFQVLKARFRRSNSVSSTGWWVAKHSTAIFCLLAPIRITPLKPDLMETSGSDHYQSFLDHLGKLVASNSLGWKCIWQILKQMNTLLCYLEKWGNPCDSRAKRCFYQWMSAQSLEGLVSSQENGKCQFDFKFRHRGDNFWKLWPFVLTLLSCTKELCNAPIHQKIKVQTPGGKNKISKKEQLELLKTSSIKKGYFLYEKIIDLTDSENNSFDPSWIKRDVQIVSVGILFVWHTNLNVYKNLLKTVLIEELYF